MLFQEIGKEVLVVDDNEDARNSIKALLELIGLKVRTLGDGERALEEIKKHKYDLLICDVSMPRVDGVELFQAIKKSEEQRNIPVVFISGLPSWSEPEEQRREIFNKVEAYIQKPFTTQVFLGTVRRLLQNDASIA